MRNAVNWKVFVLLLIASLLSVLAIFPYVMTVQKDLFAIIPIPLPLVIGMQFIQSAILFSLAIFVGLYLGKRSGFTTSILESLVEKKQ